jgi:hypothetical protein
MRIRFITFDHPTPIAPEVLSEIQRECNAQINYTGLTFAHNEETAKLPPSCVYIAELLRDCDDSGAKLIAYLRVLLK